MNPPPPPTPLTRTRARRAYHPLRYIVDTLVDRNVSEAAVVQLKDDILHLTPNDRDNLMNELAGRGFNLSQRSRAIMEGDMGAMKRKKRVSRRRKRSTGRVRV